MEYDANKVMPVNPTVDFFNEHIIETIDTSIRLQPNIDGISDEKANAIKFRAMDIIARKYEFGKYRHLCKTCRKDFATCKADPIFGKLESEDNVCYCEQYIGSISKKNVSRGLSK